MKLPQNFSDPTCWFRIELNKNVINIIFPFSCFYLASSKDKNWFGLCNGLKGKIGKMLNKPEDHKVLRRWWKESWKRLDFLSTFINFPLPRVQLMPWLRCQATFSLTKKQFSQVENLKVFLKSSSETRNKRPNRYRETFIRNRKSLFVYWIYLVFVVLFA